jgi:hypothetical protein
MVWVFKCFENDIIMNNVNLHNLMMGPNFLRYTKILLRHHPYFMFLSNLILPYPKHKVDDIDRIKNYGA